MYVVAGHVAFFGFTAELRDPRDFPKALYLLQSVSTSFYIIVAVVIYYYAGPSVPAPALSAASPLVRKIAYGIAIPTIVVAGVVNGHVACKQLYVRWWRGTNVMQQKSFKSVASWVFICAGLWVLSWLIAEAIPSFSQLLALVVCTLPIKPTASMLIKPFLNRVRSSADGLAVSSTAFKDRIVLVVLLTQANNRWSQRSVLAEDEQGPALRFPTKDRSYGRQYLYCLHWNNNCESWWHQSKLLVSAAHVY